MRHLPQDSFGLSMITESKNSEPNSPQRESQAAFVARGKASIERSIENGDGVPAEVVIAKLTAKLVAARKRQLELREIQ